MRPIPWYDIAFEVISHIDPCDTPTLLACTLTHSLWTIPAQRRLYQTLKIRNGEGMRRWYEFDTNDRLTSYVRHLIYCGDEGNPLRPRDFLEMYGRQFLCFNKLHTLEIRHLDLEQFDLNSFMLAFGHLGDTLRALLIGNVKMSLNRFLELLSLFPRLQCLGLACFTIGREPSPVPSERPTFRGTLNLSGPVDKHGLRFITDLTRMLPNFSSVRLRLNLSYHATRRLLETPGLANNVTTMLLGYQDGIPECIDLSRCHNLRMLSIRTQGRSERLSTSLATQEKLFRLLETLTSRELEFIIIEASCELSLMRYRTWGYFFKVFSTLQASCKHLSIVVDPCERFMAKNFKKGEILARFLGFGNEDKRILGHCVDTVY
ncbi:hypothetical protein BDM02DRAFT_3189225 [Thelephora ganbajun]|uniref:Uncharacterized protein n=1 Tax=Thelephora ganbajun TaxID=370292 RepID=A0ACB6Z8X8_THEGA|nr:hypothetical protein BDM02DRAFT_3189225 [Thelephora ganbajun]